MELSLIFIYSYEKSCGNVIIKTIFWYVLQFSANFKFHKKYILT